MTEAEISYADMQAAVRDGYACGKCGGRLAIAWGGSLGINGHILRCGNDTNHAGMTRHDKQYEKKKREAFSMDSTALMTMPEGKMIERIDMARFPQQLNPADKRLLAVAAITYGFDPLMGELTIFQGKPFVSIDGRYRKAQESGKLDGVETRPATKDERAAWEIPDGDYFFRAEVYVKGAGRPFVGWGRVRTEERDPKGKFKPVDVNPQRMAEKRAEAQALRKAFHIPLPSMEDIGAEMVDVRTGEIVDEPPAAISPPVREDPPTPTPPTSEAKTVKTAAPLTDAEKEFDAIPSASQQKLATPKKLPPVTNEETEAFIAWLKANNLTGQMIKDKMNMTWMECLADIPTAKRKIKEAFALKD